MLFLDDFIDATLCRIDLISCLFSVFVCAFFMYSTANSWVTSHLHSQVMVFFLVFDPKDMCAHHQYRCCRVLRFSFHQGNWAFGIQNFKYSQSTTFRGLSKMLWFSCFFFVFRIKYEEYFELRKCYKNVLNSKINRLLTDNARFFMQISSKFQRNRKWVIYIGN